MDCAAATFRWSGDIENVADISLCNGGVATKRYALIAVLLALILAIQLLRGSGSQHVPQAQTYATRQVPNLTTKPATQPYWFSLMAMSPVKSLGSDRNTTTFQWYGPDYRRVRAVRPVSMEIRSADNSRQIATVRFGMESGRTRGGSDNLGRYGPIRSLPDGDYILALTVGNHVRVSNVTALKIDSTFDVEQEPAIRLVPIPLSPGETLPSVGVIVTVPKDLAPTVMREHYFFPPLTIDGVRYRRPQSDMPTGPGGLFKPGEQVMQLIHLDDYIPAVPVKAQYQVTASLFNYVSDEVTIPADDTLGRAWDQATATIGTTQPAKPPAPEAP